MVTIAQHAISSKSPFVPTFVVRRCPPCKKRIYGYHETKKKKVGERVCKEGEKVAEVI
jgi:hypothetical protein